MVDVVHFSHMKGYVTNIEKASLRNEHFRQVLYTDKKVQLVIMSLLPGEDIGEEVHDLDQFIRIEAGSGKAVLDGVSHDVADGSVIVIPQGTRHNITNSTTASMKLYTLYAPPDHKDGTVHKTKTDAEADTGDHFDGKTSE